MSQTLTVQADSMCQKASKARKQHKASSGLSRVAEKLRNKALISDLRKAGFHVSRKADRAVRT